MDFKENNEMYGKKIGMLEDLIVEQQVNDNTRRNKEYGKDWAQLKVPKDVQEQEMRREQG